MLVALHTLEPLGVRALRAQVDALQSSGKAKSAPPSAFCAGHAFTPPEFSSWSVWVTNTIGVPAEVEVTPTRAAVTLVAKLKLRPSPDGARSCVSFRLGLRPEKMCTLP